MKEKVLSSNSSDTSKLSTRDLELLVESLKSQCHRDSTRKMYYRLWKQFAQFFQRLDQKPKHWEPRITLFIGYLVEKNMQSATIRTYLSAIRAVLKINGL